ncbi:DUF983 domain-containing protein [Novosphingobium sp. JCM 18896]|uniref:DUF983 domain-containing protein n=1 Tax=Novosphingobium sp. JCM 18896 TaxID=2989731 RepID=UPI002221A17B|nr:DUF983 domain-containing protein [Novosphingobium sp. JCM 18896]MCW1430426.1 DUF983 domain-containing protein [Novosphingobium sp. JCM 18896]
MTDENPNTEGQPGLVPAALFGLCPRCGARTLFAGLAKFADRCPACGLDFTTFNVGDGPAAFLTLIIGALITALAIGLELTAHPPFWLHALLWIPLTGAAVVWGLRAGKGALLAAEYQRRAGDGQAKDE